MTRRYEDDFDRSEDDWQSHRERNERRFRYGRDSQGGERSPSYRWIESRPYPEWSQGFGMPASSSSSQRGGYSGKGPRGYTRSDDRVREDVCDRLSWDDEVDASDITVTVSQGEVTLEGNVPDRHSKRHAGSGTRNQPQTTGTSGYSNAHNSR